METFWSLTPRETWMMMEAQAWRAEQEQRGRAWLAWHTAALARMKRLPPLARLLGQPEARALSEDERVERRAEFEELKARLPARLRGRGQEKRAGLVPAPMSGAMGDIDG